MADLNALEQRIKEQLALSEERRQLQQNNVQQQMEEWKQQPDRHTKNERMAILEEAVALAKGYEKTATPALPGWEGSGQRPHSNIRDADPALAPPRRNSLDLNHFPGSVHLDLPHFAVLHLAADFVVAVRQLVGVVKGDVRATLPWAVFTNTSGTWSRVTRTDSPGTPQPAKRAGATRALTKTTKITIARRIRTLPPRLRHRHGWTGPCKSGDSLTFEQLYVPVGEQEIASPRMLAGEAIRPPSRANRARRRPRRCGRGRNPRRSTRRAVRGSPAAAPSAFVTDPTHVAWHHRRNERSPTIRVRLTVLDVRQDRDAAAAEEIALAVHSRYADTRNRGVAGRRTASGSGPIGTPVRVYCVAVQVGGTLSDGQMYDLTAWTRAVLLAGASMFWSNWMTL